VVVVAEQIWQGLLLVRVESEVVVLALSANLQRN
jgi:hypothetical protein